jgi:Flp pilus assembly protein TadG
MRTDRERGIAATEFALVLGVLVLVFMGIVETGNMLRTYYVVLDASREGARGVLRDNIQPADAPKVGNLVKTIAAKLPPSTLTTTATWTPATQDGNGIITVEVNYGYQSLFGGGQQGSPGLVMLRATSTMPLP